MKQIIQRTRFILLLVILCGVSWQPVMAKEKVSLNSSQSNRDYSQKDLEGFIEELLQYNPELQSLVAKINAAHAFVPQSSALDDPRLSFDASNIPIDNPSLSRTPMTGMQIYLRQKIPFPGKLGLKKKIAKSMEAQAVEEHLEKLNQLVAKFKAAFYDYAYITKAIDVSRKTKGRLNGLTKTLEAKYSAGQVPQQNVLRTKVEASKIQDRLIEQKKLKKILATRISTLLNRPQGTPLKIIFSNKSLTKIQQPLDQLLETAKKSRPWLGKADKKIDEATYHNKLAKRGLLPDFDFSAGYRIRDNSLSEPIGGEDFFSTGVSINIPIWSFRKQGKKITQTRHQLTAAKQSKEALEQEVTYQVEKLFYEIAQLKDQHSLYRSRIIPESKAALSSSKKSYEANEIDYLNVITNELGLFNDELTLHRYYFEHEKKIAELEMAIGKPLAPSNNKGDTL